jgi:hypothetical protein
MAGVLKVLLWAYGIMLIVFGLLGIFFPDWMSGSLFGVDNITGFVKLTMGMLGAVYIAAGVWLAAAGRDPLKDISWVKFVILKIALSVVLFVYSLVQSYIEVSAVNIIFLIVDFIWGLAFLIAYPWRTKRAS